MSRMTQADWTVYGVLRNVKGKAYAEEYRHKRNKKNAEYGIGLRKRDNGWTLVKDYDINGILVKQFICGEMTEMDQAVFEEQEWISIPYSPYDCTGKPFSQWMSFFKVPGGYWIYHRIGIDV